MVRVTATTDGRALVVQLLPAEKGEALARGNQRCSEGQRKGKRQGFW